MSKNQYRGKNFRKGKGGNNGVKVDKQNPKFDNKCDSEQTKPSALGADGRAANDISYYNKLPVLFADSTRVPFNKLEGALYHTSRGFGSTKLDFRRSLPGVCAIDYYPLLGDAKGEDSAPNRAFKSLYSYMYSHTSGAFQVSQGSVAMITVCAKSIVGMIAYMEKIHSASFMWDGKNLNYPTLVLQSMGVLASSVLGHQDTFRQELNNHIRSFNKLCIPGYLDIFEREYKLVKNMYAESLDPSSAIYHFRPAGYYTIELNQETGEYLQWHSIDYDTTASYTKFMDIVGEQLANVRNSGSFALVSGAIQRAFGDSGFMEIAPVQVDASVPPVYEPTIMWQISNLQTFKLKETEGALDITFDPVDNNLKFDVTLTDTAAILARNTNADKIRSYNGEKGPEFIMECTRLHPMVQILDYTLGKEPTYRFTYGTEIPKRLVIYSYYSSTNEGDLNPVLQKTELQVPLNLQVYNGGVGTVATQLAPINDIAKFTYSPITTIVIQDTADEPTIGKFTAELILDPLCTWTDLDFEAAQGLNQCALLSLYTTKNTGVL